MAYIVMKVKLLRVLRVDGLLAKHSYDVARTNLLLRTPETTRQVKR